MKSAKCSGGCFRIQRYIASGSTSSRIKCSSSLVGAVISSIVAAKRSGQPTSACTSSSGHAGIERAQLHLALGVSEIQERLVGDHQLRPAAGQAQPSAAVAAGQVAGAGEKIQLLDERAALQTHDHERALRVDRDFAGAAAARQAHLRFGVVADDGGVEVAVAIDLRAAEQRDLDQAPLQV